MTSRPLPARDRPTCRAWSSSWTRARAAVRALVGGRDFGHSQYDRALQARRQPGSAFKPIVYAAALEAGLTMTTRIDVTPVELSGSSGTWRPSDHVDTLEAMPVRQAVALSSNNAAVRVGRWVGEDQVISTARALGITTPMQPYPSLHLGAAEVVPAELVAAYAAFANGGRQVRPRLITRIESAQGRMLWTAPTGSAAAIDPRIAYMTLSLIEGVVDEGTGSAVRSSGFWLPAAGKTGTTNDNKDAWFVGMTPDLVAGVWIGFDRPTTIAGNAGGGSLATPVWAAMMNEVYRTRPAPAGWSPPEGLVAMPVDTESGMIATEDCPLEQVRAEYFMPGTEPREFCPLHGGGVERFFERLWRGVKSATEICRRELRGGNCEGGGAARGELRGEIEEAGTAIDHRGSRLSLLPLASASLLSPRFSRLASPTCLAKDSRSAPPRSPAPATALRRHRDATASAPPRARTCSRCPPR